MKELIKQNSTSVLKTVFAQVTSSGAGQSGVAYNTSGITAYYFREGDTSSTAISLQTMTLGTWASGGLKLIDDTNMTGDLQIGLPNACFTALGSVTVHIQGVSGMLPIVLEFQVVAFDPNDAVHLGLSALPNVASGSAGAIPTTGTGANQINVNGGRADANVTYLLGTAWLTPAVAGTPDVNAKQIGGQVAALDANNLLKVDVEDWKGNAVPATNVAGVPLIDAKYLLGTVFATPATAGVMDVNAKNVNNVSTSNVTTINANLGTTQPVNFTGTGASALVKCDTEDWGGTAVGGMPNSTTPPTTTAIASAVWQDITAGDFTVASSVGKSLMNGVALGNGLKIAECVLVDTLTTYTGNTPQTGDAYVRIGATGSGLTSLAPASTALSTANWTNARAGYLDNLNVGGPVASHADIVAINQSASKHLLLTTVGQYEPGETYTIEMRTFAAADGSAVSVDSAGSGSISAASNASPIQITSTAHGLSSGTMVTITGVLGNTAANGTWTITVVDANNFTLNGSTGNGAYTSGGTWTVPTLTATGQISGNLSANLSAVSRVATGVYRWTYTPGASPTLEQIRFDGSATINGSTFTLSAYSQTVDFATAVFTATDQSHLTSIFNKLPTNNIADETLLLAAIGSPWQVGTKYPVLLNASDVTGSVASDLQTIKGQTVTCAAGVTIGAFVGNATHALAVDTNGNVTVGGYAANEDPATLVLAGTPSNTPTAGTVAWLLRLIDADVYTVTTGNPWVLDYMVRGSGAPGTGTLLTSKGVYDTGGSPIASTSVVVGGLH